MPDLKQHDEDPVEELINGDDGICTTCDGTGDHNGHLCKDCGGKGLVG